VNKDLIERFVAESTICQGHPQIDGTYFDKEKFAELIVRECAGVGYEASYYECALNVSNKILEHFGIK